MVGNICETQIIGVTHEDRLTERKGESAGEKGDNYSENAVKNVNSLVATIVVVNCKQTG